MHVSRPAPTSPPSLALALRRWTAFFSLPFALVVAVSGLGSLLWLPETLGLLGFGRGVSLGVGAFACVFCLALAGSVANSALKCLRHEGPALVVDARGITDRFYLNASIAWRDIGSASVDDGDGDKLVLVLRAGALLPDGAVVRKTWPRRVGRLFSGGDVQVPLHGVIYQPKRLRDTLEWHLARARRESRG